MPCSMDQLGSPAEQVHQIHDDALRRRVLVQEKRNEPTAKGLGGGVALQFVIDDDCSEIEEVSARPSGV